MLCIGVKMSSKNVNIESKKKKKKQHERRLRREQQQQKKKKRKRKEPIGEHAQCQKIQNKGMNFETQVYICK